MSISNRSVACARVGLLAGLCMAAWALPTAVGAQQAPTVYRCPGPPVLYTDTLTPAEARSKNCKPLTDLPVAVAPPPPPVSRPAPAAMPGPAVGQGAAANTAGVTAVNAQGATAGTPASGFVTPPPGGTRIGAQGMAGAPVGSSASSTSGTVASPAPASATPVATGAAATVANVDTRVRPDDQRSRDLEARRILEAELRREEARLNDAVKASATAKPGERVGADAAQIRRAESDIEAIRRELGRLR